MSILRRMVSFLLTFAAANAMAISLQYVTLKPYQDSLKDWMGTHITLYLLSTFILYLLIVGLGALVNNVYFAIGLTAALIGSVSFSQYHKLKLLGEPLYPWDLKQLVNLSEMLKIARGIASPAVLMAAAGGVVLALAATFALPRVKRKLPSRMAWVAAGLLTVFFCFHIQHSVFAKPLAKMGMVNYNWNQRENYLMNGFMLAFLQNINSKIQSQPPDYNEAAVSPIAGKYASLAANPSGINGEKPNIVVVMDESLFDPTRLSGVTFSEDPMANIHRLQAVYPSGTTLSPMYGGGTSNVEFEALTGLSMSFLNQGTVPYQQLLVNKTSFPSMVSLLKDQGYSATAVHPFDGTFYNRNRVYPVLGFDRFITQDDIAYKDKLSPNAFISDRAAAQQVVDVLKEGDQPHFVHLVTMQNHLPIMEGLNGPNTVTVTGLEGSGKTELESYSQSVKETDKAIGYLVEAVQAIKRPTLVLVFGDHLPALEDSTLFPTTGNMSGAEQQQFIHETPLLIAANYPLEQKPLGALSPSFFGPVLFQLAGLPEPPFYQMLNTVRQQLPGVSRNVYVNHEGQPLLELTQDQTNLLHEYELVQYDILYGKGYAASMLP